MIQFYKLSENGYPLISPILLDDFIKYTVGEEPQELKDALEKEALSNAASAYKQDISKKLATLTVKTSNGNVFDAYSQARQDMADAILASAKLGRTTTKWKMADNSEVFIDIDELKEAHALAIQEYARVKGIGE